MKDLEKKFKELCGLLDMVEATSALTRDQLRKARYAAGELSVLLVQAGVSKMNICDQYGMPVPGDLVLLELNYPARITLSEADKIRNIPWYRPRGAGERILVSYADLNGCLPDLRDAPQPTSIGLVELGVIDRIDCAKHRWTPSDGFYCA